MNPKDKWLLSGKCIDRTKDPGRYMKDTLCCETAHEKKFHEFMKRMGIGGCHSVAPQSVKKNTHGTLSHNLVERK
jgi:hypothetical protein